MKQKLLTDIELDVHELKYLMESFSKESTQTLSELLKRSITRMQGHLDELLQDVDTVCESLPPSPIVEEYKESDTFVAEPEPPVADESVTEESVFIEDEVSKPTVLGESIKLSAGGLRQSISLNDSFRFSRELFGGDTDLMNRVIEQISVMSSYKTAVAFLSSKADMNEENEAAIDFLELLKKYFNQSA